jgi:hypothetical protein
MKESDKDRMMELSTHFPFLPFNIQGSFSMHQLQLNKMHSGQPNQDTKEFKT